MSEKLSDDVLLKLAKNRYRMAEAKYALDQALIRATAVTDLLLEASACAESQSCTLPANSVWGCADSIIRELEEIRLILEAEGVIEGA